MYIYRRVQEILLSYSFTERRRHTIQKYIGTYRVFASPDLTTKKTSTNENDTFLKAKHGIQVYRQDEDILAIYFSGGKNTYTLDTVLQLENAGVNLFLHIDGDKESVYLVPEEQLHIVNRIIKFQTQGKNVKPTSIKTARRQIK